MDVNASFDAFDAEVLRRRREISNLALEASRKREMLKAIKANYNKAENARVRALRNGGFDSIADRDAFDLKKQGQAVSRSIQRIEGELAGRRLDMMEVQARAKAERREAHRKNAERNRGACGGMAHKKAVGLAFAIANAVADRDYILADRLVVQLGEVKPGWRDFQNGEV